MKEEKEKEKREKQARLKKYNYTQGIDEDYSERLRSIRNLREAELEA